MLPLIWLGTELFANPMSQREFNSYFFVIYGSRKLGNNQPILSLDFRADIPTTKSQTVNILDTSVF